MGYFKVKLLNDHAKIPSKAEPGAAGYDICSTESVELQKGTRKAISTGISTEVSKDHYIRVAPRSGLSLRGIDIGAGVVDSSYRGEIKVLMINNSGEDYYVNKFDRIAQLIIEKCENYPVSLCTELNQSERGNGGFGSTGK